jgi:hypothetical protein
MPANTPQIALVKNSPSDRAQYRYILSGHSRALAMASYITDSTADRWHDTGRRTEPSWRSCVNHQLGSRSEGTGSPRNRDVNSARSRVGRQSQFTLITSNPTEVSGHSSSSMTTRKVCVLITTTCTSIRISRRQLHVEPTEPPFPNQSLNPRVRPTFRWSPHFRNSKHPGGFARLVA